MLIILLFLALTRALRAAPAPLHTRMETDFKNGTLVYESRDITQNHYGERSVNDIAISCLATIFACTWSAIHPNIPSPTDCWWTRFKRQFTTVLYALLAPKLITVWALKQHWAAREFVEEYNQVMIPYITAELIEIRTSRHTLRDLFQDSVLHNYMFQEGKGPRWTMAHAFFLQMGDFVMSEGGKPFRTLYIRRSSSELIDCIRKGIIDPPRITEEDIQDRSKGDAISKALIILQTTWFIAQCIARWVERLPVTELEVITLGFALLNGITYALWWNKPQNVNRPVFLEMKKPLLVNESRPGETIVLRTPIVSMVELGDGTGDGTTVQGLALNEAHNDTHIEAHNESKKETWLRRKLRLGTTNSAIWALLWHIPSYSIHILLHPLLKLILPGMAQKLEHCNLHVGTFYTSLPQNISVIARVRLHLLLVSAIGTLFGCVHLISSWYIEFPSLQEKWLWRACAIVITGEPILGGLSAIIICNFRGPQRFLFIIRCTVGYIGLPLYLFSRIILITLAIIALRSPPAHALQTIEWTTFIPHL